MDATFEKITKFLGSTWVVALYGAWMIIHTGILFVTSGVTNDNYLSFVSELAIEIGFLILRGANVQSERQEQSVKKDLAASRRIEKKIDKH